MQAVPYVFKKAAYANPERSENNVEEMKKHRAPFPKGSPLQAYFETLPKAVQEQFVQSGAPVSTVEQLKQCVEHLGGNNGKTV